MTPAGGKLWKHKYRIGGVKEGKLSLGSYTDVGLKDARELRDAARKLVTQGVDPAEQKRHSKHIAKISAANSFSAVAKAYIDKRAREGSADATTCRRNWLLQLVERPLGHRPIAEIAPYEVLEALRRYETTNRVHAAHRALQFVGQVFRFAVANQLLPSDPTRDLRGALTSHKANDNEFRHHVRRLIFLSHPRENRGAVIKFAEARAVLMHLDDEKRGDAIWALADVLEGSKNGAEWEIFIEPFIENAWPRQVRFRTEKASRGFARLIECSGNHFPQAIKLLLDLDLLRAVSHLDMITYRLAKTPKDEDGNFATRFPRDTLALLDALIADDRAQRPYELGKVLEVIAEAEPMLRQTKAWRRLQDLTI